MCVHARVWLCACVCGCVVAWLRACARTCGCVRAWLCACVRSYVRACAQTSVDLISYQFCFCRPPPLPPPPSLWSIAPIQVSESRAHVPNELGVVWFSQYAPHASTSIPLYVSAKEVSMGVRTCACSRVWLRMHVCACACSCVRLSSLRVLLLVLFVYRPQIYARTPTHSQTRPTPTPTPTHAHAQIPVAFTSGSLFKFDASASYWIHAAVGNWAARFH